MHGSPEIKQYNHFFLRWTWSINRDFRPGRLIEHEAYVIETLEYAWKLHTLDRNSTGMRLPITERSLKTASNVQFSYT